jgi:hypothetical protein
MHRLHLRVSKKMAMLMGCLHGRFRRRSRCGAKGGGRPAAGEWRRGARLGKNEEEAGGCFLTTRRSLGGTESGGEGNNGEDRRRLSEFKDGGSELDWKR